MIASHTHPHTVDPRYVTAGEKVIVNMHNAGLMSPDSTNNGRQHVQAWRAPLPQQQGYQRWRFTHTGDGCFTVQNVSSGRHLEPRRRDENQGVYDDIKPGTWVWLESGSPHGARQEWSLIPFGDLYMFVLRTPPTPSACAISATTTATWTCTTPTAPAATCGGSPTPHDPVDRACDPFVVVLWSCGPVVCASRPVPRRSCAGGRRLLSPA